jgi:asparagine synthase (glutamine-hydrolysing)
VHACSVTFPRHPAADESSLIAEVAATIRAERTTLPFQGGSALAAAERFIEEWELPPPVPNHFVWEPLTRAAALAGVRVMLDGEGGDEAFGLAPFLLADLVMRGRPLAALRYARAIPGARRSRRLMIEQLLEYGLLGAVPHGAHHRAAAGPSWLAPRARALLDHDRWRWKLADGPRWWAQLAYALTLQPERLGAWDYFRRRAASAGLTARHPLRDLDLVELVLGLRPELSFDAHLTRPLLREAMAGAVPDKVRLRAGKSLYDALAADALAGPDLAVARTLLAARDAEVRRYTEADSVARLLCVPRGAASGWSRPVWRLATAELWLRREAGGNALVHGPFLGFRDSTCDTTLVS